jgi:hypothetical protein
VNISRECGDCQSLDGANIKVVLYGKVHMQNDELRPEMVVAVEYGGKWQRAKVIGPVTLTKGNLTEITGWKLHVGPSALDLTFDADKIFPHETSN